jgi:hypothetical protein
MRAMKKFHRDARGGAGAVPAAQATRAIIVRGTCP